MASQSPQLVRGRHRRSQETACSECSLTELVRAIEDGQSQAWEVLVHRLRPIVRRRLTQFNVDPELKNDAEAETWATLYEKLSSIRNPEALVGWISLVAKSRMIDIIRRHGDREIIRPPEETASAVHYLERDRLIDHEVGVMLNRAVDRLSEREQAVLRGRLLSEEPASLRSMGNVLNMPVGSIGPTLGRGLAKLRTDPELMQYLAGERYLAAA